MTAWLRRRPSLPPGERIYAVGDVHGRFDLLDRMLQRVEREKVSLPPAQTSILLLGDLIDRGPQSRFVVEAAMRLRLANFVACLKGNHEEVAVAAWHGDLEALSGWLRHGGIATLQSYGAEVDDDLDIDTLSTDDLRDIRALLHEAIPQSVIDWLDALPLHYTRGDYLFVHAGIRPGIPLDRQQDADLLWIRDDFLDYRRSFGRIVVHGHSVTDLVDIHRNRIGVDTGACRTSRLSAIRLYGDRQDVISIDETNVPDEDER